MLKYFFKRDTLFATLAVFLIILAFKFIPLNLHIFDPIKAALSDIEFNDLAFSKTNKENKYDENIIVIDADTANRKDLAFLIDKLSDYSPSVIGVDLLFLKEGKDSVANRMLGSILKNTPNLVQAVKLYWEDEKPLIQNYYSMQVANFGYANFIGEDKGVIRSYSPFETTKSASFKSFTSAIVEKADINKYNELEKRDHEIEIINYKRDASNYKIFSWLDIISNTIDSSLIKNKIVLLGYIDKTGYNIEDKHYTPLNENFIHKKLPDMDGVIIHANILSMILNDQYIRRIPVWLDVLLAILLTYFHIALFINYYIHNHKWFHIRFKAIQFLSSIVFIYIGILLLRWRIYFDFTLLLTAVILSVDVLYFYEGFAKWLERKISFKTIFTDSKH